jgi:hypothetical protein
VIKLGSVQYSNPLVQPGFVQRGFDYLPLEVIKYFEGRGRSAYD